MRFTRFIRIFVLLLPLALLLGAIPCAAAETPSVLEPSELDAILAELAAERDMDEAHFGLAYYYTGTGESYFYNGDFSPYGASLYKVPLCMRLAEMVKNGELALTDRMGGYTVEQIMEMALVWSSNPHALTAFSEMGSSRSERWAALNSYSGIPLEELSERYDEGFFSPRFMLNTLLTLYNDPDCFPGVLDYMKQANPGYYFRRTLEDQYTVAQKYGNITNGGYYMHAAGIIYTPSPFILVVMTLNVHDSYPLLGELAECFADYTLTLDERVAALPSLTPEAAPEPTPEPTAAPMSAPDTAAGGIEPTDGFPSWLPFVVGAALMPGVGALFARKKKR